MSTVGEGEPGAERPVSLVGGVDGGDHTPVVGRTPELLTASTVVP